MSRGFEPFTTARVDGRSDALVVFDAVTGSEPGSEFSYDELAEKLNVGIAKPVTRDRIGRAVRRANVMLMKRDNRAMTNVRDAGYKVMHASDHLPAAMGHRDRAERQMLQGIRLLQHANLDELTPTQRTLHQGHLLIHQGIYQVVKQTAARLDRQEKALDQVRNQQREKEGEIEDRLAKLEDSLRDTK